MTAVAIHCDASQSRGMGHIVRQIHLGNVLRHKGADLLFFVPSYEPTRALLKRHGFDFREINQPEELSKVDSLAFDHFILDRRNTTAELITLLRCVAKNITSLEDLGTGRDFVDLLIDCNLKEADAQKVAPGVKNLFGWDYSILAEEFSNYHNKPRSFDSTERRILVSMGGTDPNQLTLRITKILIGQHLPRQTYSLLAGPGLENLDELKQLTEKHAACTILSNVANMAELLFSQDMVICSGGVTLHEAMAVGTPAITISQVPHQDKNAQDIERHGAIINLGLGKIFDPTRLLTSLQIPETKLQKMSLAGKNLIDGQGIHRVASAILSL
jgi:spore coat polysaccharide biosynthesis predicted glycosyltransferase SpsG